MRISEILQVARRYGGASQLYRLIRKDPAAAARAALRLGFYRWERTIFGGRAHWVTFRDELRDSGLVDQLERKLSAAFAGLDGATARGNPFIPGHMQRMHAEVLYAIVRHRQPDVVVETGVCNGFSTAILLSAMHRNAKGRLISIDLPEFTSSGQDNTVFWPGKLGAVVAPGRLPGWLVPRDMQGRWRLELGPSQQILPRVLDEQKAIDIFIHDSEHSYQNQIFEFRSAFRKLLPDGLLIATDIGWSNALDDFWREVKRSAQRTFVDHAMAVIMKAH